MHISFTRVCKGDYLNYMVSLICICRWRGFYNFLDCHKNFLRQFTGRSGALAWTLGKIIFGHDVIDIFKVAYCNSRPAPQSLKLITIINDDTISPPFAKTMWTIFFESDKFSSLVMVDGITEVQ